MTDTPETPDTHITTLEEAKAAEVEMAHLETQDELAKLKLQMEIA